MRRAKVFLSACAVQRTGCADNTERAGQSGIINRHIPRKDEDWMKKTKRLRALSGVASAALLASYLLPLGEIPPALTARAADDDRPVYAKEITPEQLLTDFNLFIEENVTATNQGHIVGSVIIGDTLDTPNAFGDGAVTSSYIHHIKNLINIAKPGLDRRSGAEGTVRKKQLRILSYK